MSQYITISVDRCSCKYAVFGTQGGAHTLTSHLTKLNFPTFLRIATHLCTKGYSPQDVDKIDTAHTVQSTTDSDLLPQLEEREEGGER